MARIRPPRVREPDGLVVHGPVHDVAIPRLLQEIHGDAAVGEPRAHPPHGPRALVALDGGGDAGDQVALVALAEMPLLVGVGGAVAEDLVAARAQALGDVGRRLVDLGVHLRLGGQAELVEQVEDAPDADAIAVVAPAVDAVALGLVGRGDGRALADPEAEGLDVEGQVDGEPAPARPGVVGSPRDVRVLVASVRGQHGVAFLPAVDPTPLAAATAPNPWADSPGCPGGW